MFGWTLCATAFFVEFGSMSLVSWATFMVAGAVPPLVFMHFDAEKDKGGRAHEVRR
jgi:hypothetical protein